MDLPGLVKLIHQLLERPLDLQSHLGQRADAMLLPERFDLSFELGVLRLKLFDLLLPLVILGLGLGDLLGVGLDGVVEDQSQGLDLLAKLVSMLKGPTRGAWSHRQVTR